MSRYGKTLIRLISFFVFLSAAAGILLVRAETAEARAAEQEEAEEVRLFLRLSEEARTAASTAVEGGDAAALTGACRAVGLLSELLGGDSVPCVCAEHAACLFRVLSDAAQKGTPGPWLADCASECAELLSSLSVLLLDGAGEDALSPCADALERLCADFAPDPMRMAEPAEQYAYTFSAEFPTTVQEAEETLRQLLGRTAALFRPVNGSPETEEEGPVFYLFSCQNGFAELSVRGGHLIRYALCPRVSPAASDSPSRILSDADLSDAAEDFLDRSGIPSAAFSEASHEDLHGMRTFRFVHRKTGASVYVGIRCFDAKPFSLDAEAFYRRESKNAG